MIQTQSRALAITIVMFISGLVFCGNIKPKTGFWFEMPKKIQAPHCEPDELFIVCAQEWLRYSEQLSNICAKRLKDSPAKNLKDLMDSCIEQELKKDST